MNRIEFIAELKVRLQKLPYDEINEAIEYYEEYFDDAGEENEQVVIAELVSPSAVAAQIIANFAVKGDTRDTTAKKSWKSAWLVVLALFASPIAVPVALSVGVVILALIISLSAVVLSFYAAGACLLIGGAATVIISFVIIAQSIPTAIFYLGVGLIFSGLGGLVIIGSTKLTKKCFNWLARLTGKFILGRKKNENYAQYGQY